MRNSFKSAFSAPAFRGRATLIELVFVALFFALSAAVILRVFIVSNAMRNESAACANASADAQDWAEWLYTQRDMRACLLENGWAEGENGALTCEKPGYTLIADGFFTQTDDIGALRGCVITAVAADETLLRLPVSRYASGGEGST